MFNVRSLAVLAALAAAGAAHADVLDVDFTDAFSNTGSLILTATPIGTGVYSVTGVAGTFDGQGITGMIIGDPFFGSTSNLFYSDPSQLPPSTIDSGFVFSTPSFHVELYEYNFGSVGYAVTETDANDNYLGSGAAYISSVSTASAVPEPSPAIFGMGALILLAGVRKFAARKSASLPVVR
jgi:hypothetical protein